MATRISIPGWGDLHYRDVCEWAVGHNVSVTADATQAGCASVRTDWLPAAYVPRVAPGESMQGIELGMDALAALADSAAAQAALSSLPEHYAAWITRQEPSSAIYPHPVGRWQKCC